MTNNTKIGPGFTYGSSGRRIGADSFHPVVDQESAHRKYAQKTQQTLRQRLKAVGAISSVFLLIMLSRGFFTENAPQFSVFNLSLVLVTMGLTGVLQSRLALETRSLRVIEILIFGSVAALITLNRYAVLSGLIDSGNFDQVADFFGRNVLPYIILILIYSIFLPNNWKRAAAVVTPIALIPLGLYLLVSLGVAELDYLFTPDQISTILFPLGLVVGTALYGTHAMNRLRTEVFQARQLGNYTLIKRLGSGGMGEVWKAGHRLLARKSAIKLIRPEMLGIQSKDGGQMLLQRFEREAQATAALTSPHSVVVHDFGTTDQGAFYYVMELLDGLDLETLVERNGPLNAARTIHILNQVCDSLADAHYHGLIHRDIKPSNIFICRMGRTYDFVKVLDFGLVKTEEMAATDATKLTLAGTTAGTPAYMPPEQATGREADPRSDIYSLGCVGYWLLTGCLVFEADHPTAMIVEHVKTPPIPPSKRTEAKIPEDLEEIILNCLEKTPQDRPKSSEHLSRLLSTCNDAGEWKPEDACQWWEMKKQVERTDDGRSN